MNINPVNILVLGQTGVGKSSLINYLMNDSKLAETGSGFPITAKGFHLHKKVINEFPIHIYDSWGLEVGVFDDWIRSLKTFINKSNRQVDCVWFCVNSNSHRIQHSEIEVMNYLISKDFDVRVVFTKVSSSQLEQLAALREVIESEIPIIKSFVYVNSVEETLMTGEHIEASGAAELYLLLAEYVAINNQAIFKKMLKNKAVSYLENEELTEEQLRHYVSELLMSNETSLIKELKEESNWLLQAKNSWTEKTSPLLKKANTVKNFVKRSKVDVQESDTSMLIDATVNQILNEPVFEQKLDEAIKKEFLKGQSIENESFCK